MVLILLLCFDLSGQILYLVQLFCIDQVSIGQCLYRDCKLF